jgi:hypothetical protein
MITGQTLTILVSKSIKDDLWNGMEIPHFVRNESAARRMNEESPPCPVIIFEIVKDVHKE